MAVDMKVGLAQLRQELNISREKLARRMDTVSIGTIRNAECGNRITYGKAEQILGAINALLTEANKPTVTMRDLGLELY